MQLGGFVISTPVNLRAIERAWGHVPSRPWPSSKLRRRRTTTTSVAVLAPAIRHSPWRLGRLPLWHACRSTSCSGRRTKGRGGLGWPSAPGVAGAGARRPARRERPLASRRPLERPLAWRPLERLLASRRGRSRQEQPLAWRPLASRRPLERRPLASRPPLASRRPLAWRPLERRPLASRWPLAWRLRVPRLWY